MEAILERQTGISQIHSFIKATGTLGKVQTKPFQNSEGCPEDHSNPRPVYSRKTADFQGQQRALRRSTSAHSSLHESASYCCCNTLPHTWCLKTAQIYHLVFLQVRDLMWVSPADIQMVAELTALLSRFGTTCVLTAEASAGCPPPQLSTPHPYRQQAV